MVAFLQKRLQVRIAGRIQEAQAGEVALGAELLGRGGEQQQGRGGRGEAFDEGVLGAGGVGRPLQVVGLVDDKQVPAGSHGLLSARRVVCEKGDAADDQLAVQKGVGLGLVAFDGRAAVCVKQAEEQVEAAPHFHEPLVHEGFGQQQQHASGAAGAVEPVQDEAGFDGLSKADFVGEQDARIPAAGDLAGDEHLMRQKVHPAADEPAHRVLKQLGASPQRLGSELKGVKFLGLPSEKPFLGGAEADGVRKVGLGYFPSLGDIDKQPGAFFDPFHHEGFPAMELQTVSLLETDAAQGGAAHRVLALFSGRRKKHLYAGRVGLHHNTQAQFRFRVADNPLPWVHPFKFHRKGREPTAKWGPQEA